VIHGVVSVEEKEGSLVEERKNRLSIVWIVATKQKKNDFAVASLADIPWKARHGSL
jgi:hypothetical protein